MRKCRLYCTVYLGLLNIWQVFLLFQENLELESTVDVFHWPVPLVKSTSSKSSHCLLPTVLQLVMIHIIYRSCIAAREITADTHITGATTPFYSGMQCGTVKELRGSAHQGPVPHLQYSQQGESVPLPEPIWRKGFKPFSSLSLWLIQDDLIKSPQFTSWHTPTKCHLPFSLLGPFQRVFFWVNSEYQVWPSFTPSILWQLARKVLMPPHPFHSHFTLHS